VSDPAIQLEGLGKTFLRGEQAVHALQDINLRIEQGSCTALMGHNGAGKSTLLKVLCGLVHADTGHGTVLGEPLGITGRQRSTMGYMTPNERSFNWRLTGRQNLHYFGALCNLPKNLRNERIQHWAEAFDVHYLDQRFDRYSTGMRQHLALLRVMLHDPSLLLLDEPARSLDGESCRTLLERLLQLKALGKTILLATHLMPLAQELCDRVITLRNGAIEADREKPQWDHNPTSHTLITSRLSSTEQEQINGLPEVLSSMTATDQAISEIQVAAQPQALQTVLARCHTLGIHIWACNQGTSDE